MHQSVPAGTDGLVGITTAADLVGVGPQTLRLYERRGLLTPARTSGGTRRYSQHNLDRVRQITELVHAGINLAGITRVLQLEQTITHLLAATGRASSPAHPEPPTDPVGRTRPGHPATGRPGKHLPLTNNGVAP